MPPTVPLTTELKLLHLGSTEVVMYSDFERIFSKYHEWNEDNSIPEIKLLQEMFLGMQKATFSLDNEVPLNKRFYKEFSETVQGKGYVVTDSLPEDSVTIFGKSQPGIVVYRSDGKYVKEKRVVGASITKESLSVQVVVGSSMEFKKKSVHLQSKPTSFLAQACANMVRVSGFLFY